MTLRPFNDLIKRIRWPVKTISTEATHQEGFTAFISYSQQDQHLAKRLHLALKEYRVPEGLDVPGLADERKLGRFFRDDENMGADPSLRDALDKLVDSSRNLIVLCTPTSAKSAWVDKEVSRFKKRAQPNVLAVIAKGQPSSGDPNTECFCPALRVKFDDRGHPTGDPDEPLAPNLQKESFKKVLARLIAGLLGIAFDDIWRHDLRRARRRKALRGTLMGTMALLLLVSVLETVRVFDASSLADQSVQISREAWARGSDDVVFDRAFRTALAATPLMGSLLEGGDSEDDCDLNGAITTPLCALALSGHGLPHVRMFDERPERQRGNFRDDIQGSSGIERRALRLNKYIGAVAFSGNSKRVAMSHTDGRLLVYDRELQRIVFEEKSISDGRRPIALNHDGTMALLDATRDQYLQSINLETGRSESISFLFDSVHDMKIIGNVWLVVASVYSTSSSRTRSSILELTDGIITSEVPIEEYTPYFSSGFSNSGDHFVSFSSNKLFLVDIREQSVSKIDVKNLGEGVGQVKTVATDTGAEWVVLGGNGSGGVDNAAQVLSLQTSRETARLAGHTGEIYSSAITPDGEVVATGGSDLTVRLWSRSAGREIYRLAGHASDINDIAISPDGSLLATTATDAVVLLWDLNATEMLGYGDVRNHVCTGDEAREQFVRPATVVTVEERQMTSMYRGRPWDLCDWRGSGTPKGFIQSLRAMLVRWAGMDFLDYSAP